MRNLIAIPKDIYKIEYDSYMFLATLKASHLAIKNFIYASVLH